MAATAAQVRRLRRMTGETTLATYSDAELREYIERYPLLDERGEPPYTFDTTTEPPTEDTNDDWIATYDLNAAAADIWEEKSAIVAPDYDFAADGASMTRSQGYTHAMQQARYYRSRRAIRTITQRPEPVDIESDSWIANAGDD